MPNEIVLTRGTKIFFAVFFALLFLSVAATFYRYMILEDYEVWIEYDDEGNPIDLELLELEEEMEV